MVVDLPSTILIGFISKVSSVGVTDVNGNSSSPPSCSPEISFRQLNDLVILGCMVNFDVEQTSGMHFNICLERTVLFLWERKVSWLGDVYQYAMDKLRNRDDLAKC